MLKQKYSSSIEINVDIVETSISSKLVDSLKYLGYKDISVNGNMIKFNCDKENEILRAYQRSFGNGDLKFDYKEKALYLTVTKYSSKVKVYLSYAINVLIIIAFLFFIFRSNRVSEIMKLIFGVVYIFYFFLGIFTDKSYQDYKQKDFLKRIKEYLTRITPATNIVYNP